MGSRRYGRGALVIDALINIVLFLALLTVLVLIHEFGHFVAARRAGVTVHEFGIGFPPRARVLFKRGDTTYTLNWLPIGGFVRLEGEQRSPADGTPDDELSQLEPEAAAAIESLDPNAFVNQSLSTRLRILSAGVAVNFVLAWIIFTLIAMFAQPTWQVRVGEVTPDSPAAAAGIVGGEYLETVTVDYADLEGVPQTAEVDRFDDSGDLIVAIDGQTFPVFDDMSQDPATAGRIAPLQYLQDRPAQAVTITIEHADGTVEDVQATLRTQAEIEQQLGALGFLVGSREFGQQGNGLVESAVIGLERTVETSTLILRAVGNIFVGIFSGSGDGIDEVAGPVGMVGVIGDVRMELPPVFLLWFVGLISANLAVINLLPIPPLDGSRMVMAVVQKLSGDRVSATTERLVYLTGWVALMMFIVFVTLSDVQKLFS
jgi:regulator of sigma E protease